MNLTSDDLFDLDGQPRAACAGRMDVFDHIIDHEKPMASMVLEAVGLCAGCPIRDACEAEYAGEDWLKRLHSGRTKEIVRREKKRQQIVRMQVELLEVKRLEAARREARRLEAAERMCACGAKALKHRTTCARCRNQKDAA